MTTLTNLLTGSAGTTVSTGNSGGVNGNSFDSVVTGTGASNAYDSTIGYPASKISTTGTSTNVYDEWNSSMGTQSQVWFRGYFYFTSNPAATIRLWTSLATSTTCGSLRVTTAGNLQCTNTSGTSILTSTATIPLNQAFRVEGFLIGSATVGQMEIKLFKNATSATADETDTSATNLNTNTSPNTYRYGISSSLANAGPYWMWGLGLSSTSYIGPALYTVPFTDSQNNGFF